MNRIMRKLSSQAGESIGETLVALLISALALVMLAGAVSSGMRVVTNSKEKMNAYYQVNNAIVAREDAATDEDGTKIEGFSKGTLSVEISHLFPTGKTIPTAECWKNGTLSGIPVIVYSE